MSRDLISQVQRVWSLTLFSGLLLQLREVWKGPHSSKAALLPNLCAGCVSEHSKQGSSCSLGKDLALPHLLAVYIWGILVHGEEIKYDPVTNLLSVLTKCTVCYPLPSLLLFSGSSLNFLRLLYQAWCRRPSRF